MTFCDRSVSLEGGTVQRIRIIGQSIVEFSDFLYYFTDFLRRGQGGLDFRKPMLSVVRQYSSICEKAQESPFGPLGHVIYEAQRRTGYFKAPRRNALMRNKKINLEKGSHQYEEDARAWGHENVTKRGDKKRALAVLYWFFRYEEEASHFREILRHALPNETEVFKRFIHAKCGGTPQDSFEEICARFREDIDIVEESFRRNFIVIGPHEGVIRNPIHQHKSNAQIFGELSELDVQICDSADSDSEIHRSRIQEKADLLEVLRDRQRRTEDYQSYARPLSQLYLKREWHDKSFQEEVAKYNDWSVEIIEKYLARENPTVLTLLLVAAANMKLNDERDLGNGLVLKYENIILGDLDKVASEIVQEYSDTVVESGVPVEHLVQSGVCAPGENGKLFEARCWRCRSCFFLQSGKYDTANLCIQNAWSALGTVSDTNVNKVDIETYLQAIMLFVEYYSPDPLKEKFEGRLTSLISRSENTVPDDTILRSGLYDLYLRFIQDYQPDDLGRKWFQFKPFAAFIIGNMERSVPGYCFLAPNELKRRSEKLMQRQQPQIKQSRLL